MSNEAKVQDFSDEIRFDRKLKGHICRLNKGFGFIEGDDGRDYFFHFSALDKFSKQFRNLKDGDKVEFQPGRTSQGPRAFCVVTLDEAV